MEKTIEFGNRDNFCIRIGFTKKPNRLYLQFWLKGIQWGNFKKSASLEYSIKTYQKIVRNKNLLYLPQLDNLSKDEIWEFMKCIDVDGSLDHERFSEMNDSGIYPFFGEHFGNQQCYHTVTYKNNYLQFMWRNDFGQPVNDVQIHFDDFCKVFEDYKVFCQDNNLI